MFYDRLVHIDIPLLPLNFDTDFLTGDSYLSACMTPLITVLMKKKYFDKIRCVVKEMLEK